MRSKGLIVFTLAAIVSLFSSPTLLAQTTAKLLVKNARLFTMAPNQKEVFIGYFVVDDEGKIKAIAAGDPPASIHAKETLDAHGHWIMPGFLSAHSHLWQAAFRGLAADKTLPGWINSLYNQRASKAHPEDFYWFTLDGALDHLQHGITAAYSFNYDGSHWGLCHENDCGEFAYRAEIDSGIRFVHGYQPDQIGSNDQLPQARARLKAFLDWQAEQPKSSRFLSVMINGSTSFNETIDQAKAEKTMMDEFHLGNQSHYLEPPDTVASERAKFKWFQEAGLLGPTLYFGHFIHPDDYILEQAVAYHCGMSWNPLSNGRLASGVADIPKYRKLGLRVGMGVDGEASADLADPFENMRTGLYAIRDKYEDATIMSPYDVLYLHTMGSADVMGVKDKLGSLEAGKYADFLVIDPTRFGTVSDPYASLVLVAGERDLEGVYVGGELIVDHGKLLHQDYDKVLMESAKRSATTSQ
ncbi:amidohydrolase family protein [Acidicapsa dinghuensis]|uniref:Amidohydrolase family protein n=1 Tax=Acidicapsa dinghuensis TaxID=2218256 RepID=A0ABW1EII0_9BACT|nr:amidohydrolase family protein [Acidicapsa dinghuensis]